MQSFFSHQSFFLHNQQKTDSIFLFPLSTDQTPQNRRRSHESSRTLLKIHHLQSPEINTAVQNHHTKNITIVRPKLRERSTSSGNQHHQDSAPPNPNLPDFQKFVGYNTNSNHSEQKSAKRIRHKPQQHHNSNFRIRASGGAKDKSSNSKQQKGIDQEETRTRGNGPNPSYLFLPFCVRLIGFSSFKSLDLHRSTTHFRKRVLKLKRIQKDEYNGIKKLWIGADFILRRRQRRRKLTGRRVGKLEKMKILLRF
jgi:hypothetical protein